MYQLRDKILYTPDLAQGALPVCPVADPEKITSGDINFD
jgi:hypothetical protein